VRWGSATLGYCYKSLIIAIGMAVNLSYALGIHKEETLPVFESREQDLRLVVSQFTLFQCLFS